MWFRYVKNATLRQGFDKLNHRPPYRNQRNTGMAFTSDLPITLLGRGHPIKFVNDLLKVFARKFHAFDGSLKLRAKLL